MKPGIQISFPDADQVSVLSARVVNRAITEQGRQPILDIVQEMPCDEDFEKWGTNACKDFLLRWYHTRSKKVQTVSLEGMLENNDDDSPIFHIPTPNQNVEEYVISKAFLEWFLETLTQKDRQIVELR